NAQLALHRDVDLDQLDHARRQLVAFGQLLFLFIDDLLEHVDLTRGHLFDLVDLLIHPRILVVVLDALQVPGGNALDRVAVEDVALGQQTLIGALVVQVGLHFLAAQDVFQALQPLVGKNSDFVRKVLLELRDLRRLDRFRALVLFLALAREDLHIHDDTLDSGRAVERSIANVSGLFAEDRAQQLLFRGELRLALRRDFAHQDVALLHRGADTDHARFIQVAQHGFADVRDVARDLFRTELGVASFDLELLNVNRGVVVLFHQLFRDQDRVLEVVTAPWHEGDQHVSSQRQLAVIGARTVGDHLTFRDPLSALDRGLLIDTGVLVGALELGYLLTVSTDLARELSGMVLAFHADDNALRVHRSNDSVPAGQNDSARIARRDAFHSGADNWSFRPQQRYRLALHVGAHQRTVGVVVLQEGHQRSGDRHQLLRADVDVIHFVTADQHEVTGLACVYQLGDDASLVVEFNVGLRDNVPVLLPCGEIERERLDLGSTLAAVLQFSIDLLDLVLLHVIADFEIAIAGVHDAHVIEHLAILHTTVRR